MVAYSFKAQFCAPILAGTKRQTIRAERKRHALPGEQLQLYTGMRTRQCRIIGRAVCSRVFPLRIGIAEGFVEVSERERWEGPDFMEAFAKADGFSSWAAMAAFWGKEHPDIAVFSGVVIRWDNLVQETPDA